MISSKILNELQKYFQIIEKYKGYSIGDIRSELKIEGHSHFKKGASGLIIENMLGLKNNSSTKADLEDIGVEIKTLPIHTNNRNGLKAKEPTQIKMINYFKVVNETWDNAEIRNKIKIIFWIVYGVEKHNGKFDSQDKYILLDYFLDYPIEETNLIFKKDWEDIKNYIIIGEGDNLSCSMGVYIEPKTKGSGNKDVTNAPDGKGGIIKVRRRAFYFKKNYTNNKIIPNLNLK